MNIIRRPFLLSLMIIASFAGAGGAGGPSDSHAQRSRQLSDQALELLREAEESDDPEERRAAYRRGLELGREAVALDDSNPDAHFAVFANNGRILLMNDVAVNPVSLMRANAELERTLELDPEHPDGLAAKGGLYRQLPWFLGGDQDEAERLLRRSIQLNPDSVGARIELAQLYNDRGDPEMSVPLLRRAASIAETQGRRKKLGEAQALLRELEER